MKRFLLFVILIGLLMVSIVSISCNQVPTRIQVATNGTYPPFSYIDEQGQIVGFDIDLMNAIAEKENLKVEFVKVDFKPLLEDIAQNKYDAAISAISITDERRQNMLFSDPYFVAGHVVTVRKDDTSITGQDSLTGKVVGFETGSTSATSVHEMEGVTAKDYADLNVGWDDVVNGVIEAIVSDSTIAYYYVARYPDKLKIAGEPFTQEYYGIAVAKNRPELLTKINAGLKTVKGEGLVEQLTQKWLSK